MEYNLYRISTGTLLEIAAVLVLGALVGVVLHRRTSMPPAQCAWTVAALVSAAAVLLITLAPSGKGGTYPCSFAIEDSVFSWLRGNQSTANVAMLVPVGVSLPLAARPTRGYVWSFPALVAFPILIEAAQAWVPLGRACDVGDVSDNWWGVAFGCLLGWAGTRIHASVRARRASP